MNKGLARRLQVPGHATEAFNSFGIRRTIASLQEHCANPVVANFHAFLGFVKFRFKALFYSEAGRQFCSFGLNWLSVAEGGVAHDVYFIEIARPGAITLVPGRKTTLDISRDMTISQGGAVYARETS